MSEVSIIMPTYESAQFISQSIASVLNQTYKDWELIIVDDCSSDNTREIVAETAAGDERIKYIRLETNSGAAAARNVAIESAQGRYLAFLDSDDLWYPQKLEKQVAFMKENGYNFTCTGYEHINEDGTPARKVIKPFKKADYNLCLYYGDCIGNLTAMYDAQNLGKFFVPEIRKRNDFAIWLQILRKEKYVYGMKEVLSSYRRRSGSLSRNKFGLVKYQWQLYRDIEKLSVFKACLALFTLAVRKVYKFVL